jgi:hypothetical protein
MHKEILSEINQMKYLFGYKAGKVISEQAVPTTGTTQPQKNSYKLDIIKNDEDFKNFLSAAADTKSWKDAGLGSKFDEIQNDVKQKTNQVEDPEILSKEGQRLSSSHAIVRSIITPLLKYAAMNGKNGQNINQLPDSSLLKMINIYMTPEEKQKIKDAPIENYIETFFGDMPSLKMGVSKLIDNKIKELGGQL